MDDVWVSTWAELQERLYEGSWREPLGRFRSSHAFRGMWHASLGLEASLMRLGGAYERHEGHPLRNFRKFAHRNAVREDSVWNWLALAQHHGLPTRLLDWTFSPFVALHIATEHPRHYGVAGVVWCVDYVAANRLLPESLRTVLEDEGSDVFTAEMLGRAAGSLPELDRLGADAFVVFFEPPSLDDRIVNQFALFSLMSRATARLDHWLARHPHLFRRIVIPAALKWEVRDKLDQANITERVLFPGLDGLSRWLKRYYSPSPRASADAVSFGRESRAADRARGEAWTRREEIPGEMTVNGCIARTLQDSSSGFEQSAQGFGLDPLDQIAVDVGPGRAAVGLVAEANQQGDPDLARAPIAQAAGDLVAVHARQRSVDEHDLRALFARRLDRRWAVAPDVDLVAPRFQETSQPRASSDWSSLMSTRLGRVVR
jgi:hypothetical protein